MATKEKEETIEIFRVEKENLGFVFPWLDPDWERAEQIDAEKESLEAENRKYERGEGGYISKVVDDNYAVTLNADFGTVSANRDYTNPSMDEYTQIPDHYDQNQWYYDENGVYRDANGNALETDEFGNWIDPRNKDWLMEDKLGLFLNATEEQRNRAAAGDWGINNVSAAFREGLDGDWTYLTDQEIGIYYYYLAQSQEKAYQYLTDMEMELDRRRTLEDIEQWEDDYKQANGFEKLWMNVETVPANLVGGFGAFVSDTVDTLQGEEINPYSTAHTLSHYNRTVRGETVKDLDDTKILGDFYTLGDLYQSGMSMVDSLVASGVGGPFGGTLLAMGAAESEAYRLYQQGASKEQIAFGAAAAGATELIFEELSLENLDAIKNMASPETLGQWFKTVLVRGGVEASEEMVTEIANTVANAVIMGSQSDWQQLMDENNGNLLGALKDKSLDVLHAGISSFASGTVSNAVRTGVPYAKYAAKRNADAKQMYGDFADSLVGEALEIDPNNAFAQRMQTRLGKGKQLTGGQLNRLVTQNEATLRKQDKTAIQQAAQTRLAELGEYKNVSEVAAVLAKQAAGENLSHAEKRLIAKSQYGQQVAGELNSENSRSDSEESSWVKSIGTERINAEAYNSALEAESTQQNTDSASNGLIADDDYAVDTVNPMDYDNAREQGGAIYESIQHRGEKLHSGRIRWYTQGDSQGETAGSPKDGGRDVRPGNQGRLYGRDGERTVLAKDSEGRTLTPEQAAKLQGTAIVDNNGVPLAVYHATDNMEFTTFEKGDTGFHFGSESQATEHSKKRGYAEGRIFRAYLSIKNPIQMNQDIMGWHPGGTALRLWGDGILSDSEVQEITALYRMGDGYDSASATRLREILEGKGYDGIAYPNGFEGEGVSYIAFHDEQIVKTEITPFNNSEPPTTQQVLQHAIENMGKKPMDPKSYNALNSYKNQLQHMNTTEALLDQKRNILQQQQATGADPSLIQQTQADIAKLEKMLAQQQNKLQTAEQTPALQKVMEQTQTAKLEKSVDDGIISVDRFNTTDDPMREVTGAGMESNPEEIREITQELQAAGVEMRYHEQNMAYSPGLFPGKPGQFIIAEGASYSAWLHEYKHFCDDRDDGFPGMRIFMDTEKCKQREIDAYNIEIALAKAQGRPDIAERLEKLKELEVSRFDKHADAD